MFRLPYLLLGNSLVLKQESKYYEHFYHELNDREPHFLEIKSDLSNLLDVIEWAKQNDDEVKNMVKNANELVD